MIQSTFFAKDMYGALYYLKERAHELSCSGYD